MGFYKDNTTEITVNGIKYRVFKQDAEAVKEAMVKRDARRGKEPQKPKPIPQPVINPEKK